MKAPVAKRAMPKKRQASSWLDPSLVQTAMKSPAMARTAQMVFLVFIAVWFLVVNVIRV